MDLGCNAKRRSGMTAQTIAVAIIHCGYDEYLIVQRVGENTWDYPGTRVAEGETLEQAAARVSSLATGLEIEPRRFDRKIRDSLGTDGVRRISFRADLFAAETAALPDRSPCGSRLLCLAHRSQLPEFIHDHRRRLMIGPAGPA